MIALLINLIPFASPSNLVLAGAIALLLPGSDRLLTPIMVAFGATISKSVHYRVSGFLAGRIGGGERRFTYLRRYGTLGTFIAAVTPIPDDPLVIPLGMAKFSFIRFFLTYFIGKLIVCSVGVYLSLELENLMAVFDYRMTAVSVILTVLAVTVLLKGSRIKFIRSLEASLRRRLESGGEST